jgi:hypothetical protein
MISVSGLQAVAKRAGRGSALARPDIMNHSPGADGQPGNDVNQVEEMETQDGQLEVVEFDFIDDRLC